MDLNRSIESQLSGTHPPFTHRVEITFGTFASGVSFATFHANNTPTRDAIDHIAGGLSIEIESVWSESLYKLDYRDPEIHSMIKIYFYRPKSSSCSSCSSLDLATTEYSMYLFRYSVGWRRDIQRLLRDSMSSTLRLLLL